MQVLLYSSAPPQPRELFFSMDCNVPVSDGRTGVISWMVSSDMKLPPLQEKLLCTDVLVYRMVKEMMKWCIQVHRRQL